jgi:hypothetical protein
MIQNAVSQIAKTNTAHLALSHKEVPFLDSDNKIAFDTLVTTS